MAVENVKLSALDDDTAIYPRGGVSPTRVDDLVYSLEAGAVLPPPVADRETLKIVDGWHRVRALRRFYGEDAEIAVDLQAFGGLAEMMVEAIRLNAAHGLPLGRYDQKQSVLRARALGASDVQVAEALGITPARVERIMLRVATSPSGVETALKNGTYHLSGRVLSDEQIQAVRRMRGGTTISKARDLSRMIESGIAPLGDGEVQLALAELRAVIDAALE